ncbi:MAG TPA: hypothetical protein VK468_03990, partial [Pyrinomonadaceae bacterium]|nr:hypothetical protein [Pyrinomonadaceae bacterium]
MRIAIIFILLFCLLALAGCSSVDPNANAANGSAADSPNGPGSTVFTDANAALAEGNRLLDIGETDRAIDVLQEAVRL